MAKEKKEKSLEEVLQSKYIFVNTPAGMSKTENPYIHKNFTLVKVNEEDFYPFEDNENLYGLKKTALFKIADVAGIQWGDCKIVKSDANVVLCKATASFRGADGSFTPFSCTKEYNLLLEEKQYRDKMLKQAIALQHSPNPEEHDVLGNATPEEWATNHTKFHMVKMRQNKVAIAETSSKMRLVRTVLNLKSGYTLDELNKGFYVARYDFVPDTNDPEVKKMFINLGFSNPLYQWVNKSNKPIDISQELPVSGDETTLFTEENLENE